MSTPIPAVNVPLNKVGEMRLWVCVSGAGGAERLDGAVPDAIKIMYKG